MKAHRTCIRWPSILTVICCGFIVITHIAQAKQQTILRAGLYTQYARLVFDWPEKTGYRAVLEGKELRIDFDQPLAADFGRVAAKLSEYIEVPITSQDGKQLRIPLRGVFGLQQKQFGKVIVIDLLRNPAALEKPAKDVKKQDVQKIALASAKRPVNRVRFLKQPLSLAPPVSGKQRGKDTDPKPGTANVISERPPAEMQADRQRVLDEAKIAQQKAKEAALAEALIQSGATSAKKISHDNDGILNLELSLKEIPGGISMRFPFSVDAAAAVFFRGPVLWAVFDKPARVDTRIVALSNNPILISAKQIEDEEFTALAFKVAPGYFIAVERRRSTWQIDLTKEPPQSGKYLEIVRDPEADAGGVVHVISANPIGPYKFIDPYVGDAMLVTPVLESGHGLAERRRFVEFEMIKSIQGLAVIPFTDKIEMKAAPGLIDIGSPAGLQLSDDIARALGEADNARKPLQSPAFMDFDGWRRGDDSKYLDSLRQLRASIAGTKLKKRIGHQKNLAQFYLAHELAAEAAGVLNQMSRENNDIVNDLEHRALSAVANYQLGRYREAEKNLDVQGLKIDPHAALWRGATLAKLGKWEAALAEFDSGFSMLGKYSPAVQADMRLLAATAALKRGEYNRSKRELTAFPLKSLPPKQAALSMLLRGRLLEARSKDDAALKAYEGAIAFHFQLVETPARLAKTLLLNKMGTIDNDRAIGQLEALRYAWRGGDVELEVLESLGRRYLENKNYREGFTVMRSALSYFSEYPAAQAIADRMSDTFADLYLHGGSDEMPPIKALALYYDFRELTPVGTDGDEMIRRLGERLVSVELLDEAIELLDHQVRNRLEGTAKAQIAARLAVIQLLDKKPAAALETIRRTRQTRLPEDLSLRRLILEARALTELSEFEQALELIADEHSKESDLLRADIYWAAQNWPQAAASLQVVLGGRWQEAAPLAAPEQAQVMRAAIAYALADQKTELDQFRANYQSKMTGSAFADSFAVITQPADGRGVAFRQLAGTIAGLDTLKDFMANYKRDL